MLLARRMLRVLVCLTAAAPAVWTQNGARKAPIEVLDRFSDSVQQLATRVAPAVVQISVSRYAPREDSGDRTGVVLGREQAVGSGAIIDPEGYIITNAHVVANALRIRVTRPSPLSASSNRPEQAIAVSLAQAVAPPIDATLVGVFKEADLALIKIPGKDLPSLTFADYRKLRQGQVVFAFGSRQGLGNSMSMGVVSSVARQPEPDSPFVYIQTDAPINPGDSGGPLVNTAGEIVGLDTFILTQSGGSEGIGFAIPSTLIQLAAVELRKYGHVHRQMIGVSVQTITATLAAALNLPRESGVLVSDVAPGGAAEDAGVKLNDIVGAVDGRRIENVPMFVTALLSHPPGEKVALQVLRGGETLSFEIPPTEESHSSDRLSDMIDSEKNRVHQLGIIGIDIGPATEKMFPDLRGPYGVIVAALSASSSASASGLEVGDVIHEINGTLVSGLASLRESMDKFKRGDAVALFIERDGKLQYLAFEVE